MKRQKHSEGASFYAGDTLDSDELSIEVFNATNEIPTPGKIGTDRDATFRLVGNDGRRIDIPAEFARNHYAISLYETLHPGRVLDRTNPSDMGKALEFSKQMDHAITDSVDARRIGYISLICLIFWGMRLEATQLYFQKLMQRTYKEPLSSKAFTYSNLCPADPKKRLSIELKRWKVRLESSLITWYFRGQPETDRHLKVSSQRKRL